MDRKLSSFAFLAHLQAHCGYLVTCNCCANKSSGVINWSLSTASIRIFTRIFLLIPWVCYNSRCLFFFYFSLIFNLQPIAMRYPVNLSFLLRALIKSQHEYLQRHCGNIWKIFNSLYIRANLWLLLHLETEHEVPIH